ncbi:DUF5391 family protein [Oikeobacillus pervagus]
MIFRICSHTFFEIVAICIVSFIVNIIWFFQAFRTSTKPATFMTK